jgi:CheY-like chemotaxis protein
MVADDHDYTRTIVAEILRGAGVRDIVGASSGYEALEDLGRVQPQLLITDWAMDGMDGSELARTIRSGAKKHREIPIIMMTGEARRSVLEQARDSGVNEYVTKPISCESIISRVRKVTTQKRAFVEIRSYIGPCRRRMKAAGRLQMRRLSDPHPVFSPEANALQQQAARMAADVHQKSLQLDPRDRGQMLALYRHTQDATKAAAESSDQHLMRALQSLLRYLEGAGASGRMDVEILGVHLQTIERIVALQAHQIDERELLVCRLEGVVTQSLNAAA